MDYIDRYCYYDAWYRSGLNRCRPLEEIFGRTVLSGEDAGVDVFDTVADGSVTGVGVG